MSKKGLIIAAVALLVLVLVIVQMTKEPDVDLTNPTVRAISEGSFEVIDEADYYIACEDARWLLDKSREMIEQKLSQLEEIDESAENLSDAQYQRMQDAVFNKLSPAQEEINDWYEKVIKGIVTFVDGDTQRERLHDAIANEHVRLYQAAMFMHLGYMEEDEVRSELEAHYCGQ